MQNQITIFNFENSTVRTAVNANNEPYFCLADVADILAIKNSSDVANKQLDKKGCVKIEIIDSLNRKQQATFINEPNLYRVIFRSNKTEAVKFQNWVFEEVLPNIRKTGGYSQKTTAQDRTPLIQACTRLSAGRMSISDVYKMVGNHFGYDDVQSIPPQQLAEATAFVYEMIIRLQPQQNPQDIDNQTETNEMWRIIGQLRHRAIQEEIIKLKIECGEFYQKLQSLQSLTGMMSDVFAYIDLKPTKEQRQSAYQKAVGGHQRNLTMHGFQ